MKVGKVHHFLSRPSQSRADYVGGVRRHGRAFDTAVRWQWVRSWPPAATALGCAFLLRRLCTAAEVFLYRVVARNGRVVRLEHVLQTTYIPYCSFDVFFAFFTVVVLGLVGSSGIFHIVFGAASTRVWTTSPRLDGCEISLLAM